MRRERTSVQGGPNAAELPLSPLSRFLLQQRNVGHPSALCHVLRYDNAEAVPTYHSISQRIQEAQRLWPLLAATVIDERTPHPAWKVNDPFSVESMVTRSTYTPGPGTRRALCQRSIRTLIPTISRGNRPLWRVFIYTAGEKDPAYIALACEHCLMDAQGSLRLLQAVLSSTPLPYPPETIKEYRRFESNIYDRRPSLLTILRLLSEAIRIRTLRFLSRFLPVPRPWPFRGVKRIIDGSAWDNMVVDYDVQLIRAVKAAGKRNGIRTLDPILRATWTFALWHAVTGRRAQTLFFMNVASFDNRLRPDRRLGVPADHKSPYCVLNDVSGFHKLSTVRPTSDFWKLAHGMRQAEDPREVAYGNGFNSLFTLTENGKIVSEVGEQFPWPEGDPSPRTGGEKAMAAFGRSWDPFSAISADGGLHTNAGFHRLPDGCTDMVFCVTAAPHNPLVTSIVGHDRGLTVSVSWNEGVVFDRRDMEKLHRAYGKILRAVAGVSGPLRMMDMFEDLRGK